MTRSERHAVRAVGDGPDTFLLAHGIGGDQHQWDPVVEQLAERGRVVTFDLAGSGESAPEAFSAARHSSLFGFADDLALLVAEAGLRGATYVGHSLSGMAGLLACAADPGLFGAVVAIGASAHYINDEAAGYVGGFTADAIDGLLGAAATDFTLWSAGFAPYVMGNSNRPELAGEFMRTMQRYRPEVAATVLRASFTSDFRAIMPRVPVRTLLLQASDDPAVPLAAAEWLRRALPAATLEVLSATGHFPHVVDPEAVADAVIRFSRSAHG